MAATLLPAANRLLGTTSNCLSYDVFSIDSVLSELGQQAFVMNNDTSPWTIPGSTVSFNVPSNVRAQYISNTVRDLKTFDSGLTMERELEASIDMQAKYLAVSGKLSAKAGLKQALAQNKMYAFITDIYERYRADLDLSQVVAAHISPALLVEIVYLPEKYDRDNAVDRQKFFDFIKKWGTHLVSGVVYGQRYTIKIEASNSESEVVANFEADLKAAYSTVVSNASVDAGVKGSSQFKQFEKEKSEVIQIRGGDSSKHAALALHPLDAAAYIDWSGSRAAVGQESPLSLKLVPLYELLENFVQQPPEVSSRAKGLQAAVAHLSEYQTITLGPKRYDGPALWVHGGKECEVKITFSGDENFRAWLPAHKKTYETDLSKTDIGAGGKSLTWSGSASMLAAGRWYYHGAKAFEYYCGDRVDVTIEVNEQVTQVVLCYGKCDPTTADEPVSPFSQQAIRFNPQKGRKQEFRGLDLRG